MKNICFAFFIAMFCTHCAFSQMTSPVRVKAGEDLYEKLAKEIFLYPAFTKGLVEFRDGKTNQAYLNYNMLVGEVQFISDKSDTLSLANELTIKCIAIGKDSFYYSGSYLQLVSGNPSAKVAKKQIIKMVDKQKVGGYDQPTSTGSITSYSSVYSNLKSYDLDIRQDVILAKNTTYFMADKYNNFFRASKKNLVKYFPKKEKELSDYVKANNINFDKEEDLVKLLNVLKDN